MKTRNKYFERDITNEIISDLREKIILLSGPRQVGKTTFAKSISKEALYLNYDNLDDREYILNRSFERKKLVIFDELHKLKNWKSWLKGIYDQEKKKYQVLVTGSARLDIAKKMGDSLAGRFFPYRLYPLSLKELKGFESPDKVLEQLLICSGFPEPFFKSQQSYYRKWRTSHLDIMIKQDLIDLESVRDISDIENLIILLQNRVGGLITYANIARDLGRDPKTIKNWINVLENLFIIFKVLPYSKNINKSILKGPKIYFYDVARVKDQGAQLENLVALALKKEIDRLQDCTGTIGQLNYLRNRDGKEVDFVVNTEDNLVTLFEVKSSDSNPSAHLSYFSSFFKNPKCIQLVKNLKKEAFYPSGIEVRKLSSFLTDFSL